MDVVRVTADQIDAIASLARLYMSTQTVEIAPGPELTGCVVVETEKWQWLIDENGRVAGEGRKEGGSDAF